MLLAVIAFGKNKYSQLYAGIIIVMKRFILVVALD